MDDSYELALSPSYDQEEAEVRLAKVRDAAIWASWYDRHFNTLYRYALVRLGAREEAEDVASQTFVRALTSIDSYQYRGRPVLAWLYTITHNLVADRLRSRRRVAVLQDMPGPRLGYNPDDHVDSIELQRAVARLKPEQREVIILRFIVALSTREVANLLGKSEAAVHSLQVRAMQSLRRLISG